MMNMKKLIDETDFDNLHELTKRWSNNQNCQKPPLSIQKESQKQNDFKKSNEIQSKITIDPKQPEQIQNSSTNLTKSNPYPPSSSTNNRKKNIVPQVIDEDTEHFKNKLQHLLNNFKTDAVAEFMNMKKQMLDYQQECVKSDTHKYLTMYQQKNKELLETKQKLLQVSRQTQKKTMQVQLLSDHIAKLNQRIKTFKYVSRPFSILYENMLKEKQLKFKMKEAAKFDQRRLKKKSVLGWVGVYKSEKSLKLKIQNESRIQKQVNEIVGKFQKEMDLLRQRLAEATRKNEQYQANKHMLQQNLKKAFLRGVCAMNMEAMQVLGNQNAQQSEWVSQKEKSNPQKSIIANNLSYVQPKSSLKQDSIQNNSMFISKTNNRLSNPSIMTENKTESIIIQPQKAQSKNFKWKQAPILGVEEIRQQQQPRIQVVRPTTQGKVIKVSDGKSTVQIKKTIIDKNSITGSRKKV